MTLAPPATASQPPRIILRPQHGWQSVQFRELWRFRELLWILALRDIKVRYKQTLLGVLWAIIQPLVVTIVSTFLFARMAKLSTDSIPPPLFYFCAMLPWQLFANSLTQAGNSLVSNQNLISKVYFPRLVIPLSAVIVGLVDFAISFLVLLAMMAYYHVYPGWQILALPVFVLLAFMAAVAVGLWLSALNVEYRDVRYVLPLLTQVLFLITPVVWSIHEVKNHVKQLLVGINPISGVVVGFRWCMLGGEAPPMRLLGVSVGFTAMLLVGGLFYFRRMEKTFADLV